MVAPDRAALGQALRQLQEAYNKLRPSLKDAEKRTIRYMRLQNGLQALVSAYRQYLPIESVERFYASPLVQMQLTPFSETAPSRGAIVRLRAMYRDLYAEFQHVGEREPSESGAWNPDP